MLKHILNQIQKSSFTPAPYKLLVIDHFLPECDYFLIEKNFPDHLPFIHAKTLLEGSSKIWKQYISTINSVMFYNSLLKKFSSRIELDITNTGLRKRDFHTAYVTESYAVTRKDTNIDRKLNQIPQTERLWMLPPHRDSQHTILSLVHHFPYPNLKPSGGSFLVLQPQKIPRYYLCNSTIPYAHPDDFDIIHEIPYKENRVIALLHSEFSWHAIGYCNFLRRSVNMSLEIQNDGKRTLC